MKDSNHSEGVFHVLSHNTEAEILQFTLFKVGLCSHLQSEVEHYEKEIQS